MAMSDLEQQMRAVEKATARIEAELIAIDQRFADHDADDRQRHTELRQDIASLRDGTRVDITSMREGTVKLMLALIGVNMVFGALIAAVVGVSLHVSKDSVTVSGAATHASASQRAGAK